MILLDTHIWLRWQNIGRLPNHWIDIIETEDEVAISAISCWELAQLVKRKKVELPIEITEWIELASMDIEILSINKEIALLSEQLPFHHKDPADRFIIATSIFYQAKLISLDTVFPQYQELNDLLIK
ncbi:MULTISPECIES: type II toxin-antitoxin system VapC family toxin [unclassified Moraxella]|uniref:type II toxin-antitoxin system VapC family toxin n=1 Tax=unclassified Moraxella TaxID=2685852 RepID=UPI003AF9F335